MLISLQIEIHVVAFSLTVLQSTTASGVNLQMMNEILLNACGSDLLTPFDAKFRKKY